MKDIQRNGRAAWSVDSRKKLKGFMLMDTYKIEITGKEELNRKIKDDDLDKWKDQV